MSSTRRFHLKSRTGCPQCKKRHIKCDGRPPRCRNCQRRGLECGYATMGLPFPTKIPGDENVQTSVAVFPQPPPGERTVHTINSIWRATLAHSLPVPGADGAWNKQSPSPKADTSLSPNLTYWDLVLMHHYATQTAHTLGNIRAVNGFLFWQVQVPQDANTHPFTMHALLSVAAYHMATMDPDRRTTGCELGLRHYNDALRLFRNSAADVNLQTLRPIVASMILVFIICVAQPRVSGHATDVSLEALLEPLNVMRRSTSFFKAIVNELGPKAVSRVFHTYQGPPPAYLPPRIVNAIELLRNTNKNSKNTLSDKFMYQKVIQLLQVGFRIAVHSPTDWRPFHYWPGSVSAEFYDHVYSKQPMALVILTYWCVSVHNLPRKWYLGDWAEDLIRAVARELGEQWLEALRWPLEEIGDPRPSYEFLLEPQVPENASDENRVVAWETGEFR